VPIVVATAKVALIPTRIRERDCRGSFELPANDRGRVESGPFAQPMMLTIYAQSMRRNDYGLFELRSRISSSEYRDFSRVYANEPCEAGWYTHITYTPHMVAEGRVNRTAGASTRWSVPNAAYLFL
jgi:hypothetical protein